MEFNKGGIVKGPIPSVFPCKICNYDIFINAIKTGAFSNLGKIKLQLPITKKEQEEFTEHMMATMFNCAGKIKGF